MGSTQHCAGNHSLLSVWRRKDASPWVEITVAVAFVMLSRDIVHSAILTDYIVDGFCDFVEKRSIGSHVYKRTIAKQYLTMQLLNKTPLMLCISSIYHVEQWVTCLQSH